MVGQGNSPARPYGRFCPTATDGETTETAEALLHRTALGDEEAFARLYGRTAPQVYVLCLKLLRDSARAEEVAQEVLVEVWRTAIRFEEIRRPARVWISTIAYRRAVDCARSVQASRERERRAAVPETPEYDQVAETADVRLEHRQVRRCLATLTELQRQAIVLAYYGGHTYGRVATLLDIAVPTVKSRIRDGLVKLRHCLEVPR